MKKQTPAFGPVPSRGEAAGGWRLTEASSAYLPSSPWWGDHAPALPPTGQRASAIGFGETWLWLSLTVPLGETKKSNKGKVIAD